MKTAGPSELIDKYLTYYTASQKTNIFNVKFPFYLFIATSMGA
jgi:hypothetical protein